MTSASSTIVSNDLVLCVSAGLNLIRTLASAVTLATVMRHSLCFHSTRLDVSLCSLRALPSSRSSIGTPSSTSTVISMRSFVWTVADKSSFLVTTSNRRANLTVRPSNSYGRTWVRSGITIAPPEYLVTTAVPRTTGMCLVMNHASDRSPGSPSRTSPCRLW